MNFELHSKHVQTAFDDPLVVLTMKVGEKVSDVALSPFMLTSMDSAQASLFGAIERLIARCYSTEA